MQCKNLKGRVTSEKCDWTQDTDRQRHALMSNTQEKPENILQPGKDWSQTDQGDSMRRGRKQKKHNSNTNTQHRETWDGWWEKESIKTKGEK